MGKVEAAADETAKASTKEIQVVDNANTLITKLGVTVDGVNTAVASTTSAMTSTLVHIDGTADAATRRIDALKAEQDAADEAIQQIATLPGAVRTALEPLPGLEESITRTSDKAGDFLAGPASSLASNGAELAGNAAMATDHFDQRWLAPYSGKHPRWHKVGQVLKFGLGLAEPTYYGIQIAK
jgi:hypothetical protein